MTSVPSVSRAALFSRSQTSSTPKPSSSRKRRWPWIVGFAAVGLLLFIWLLPTIVAHSFLLHWIIGYMTADFQGEIRVGSASLGWFSPIRLEQIEVYDVQQDPLAVVGRASSDRTLWQLFWNRQDLGRFLLEEPNLKVCLRPNGSNWEDALAHYLSSTEPSTLSAKIEVEVKNGMASLTDTRSGDCWRLENLQANIVVSPTQPLSWQFVCGGRSIEVGAHAEGAAPSPAGEFQFRLVWGSSVDPGQASSVSESAPPSESVLDGGIFLALKGERVPLGLAEAILMRWAPQVHLAGRGSGWLEYRWGPLAASKQPQQTTSVSGVGPAQPTQASPAQGASPRLAGLSEGRLAQTASNGAIGNPLGNDAGSEASPPSTPTGEGGGSADAILIRGNIVAEEASIGWPGVLAETILLHQMDIQGGIVWTDEYIALEDVQLQCEAGHLAVAGRVDLRSPAEADWWEALRRHQYQASGQLDLAQLVRILPKTLRIQKGVEVTQGRVELALSTRAAAEGMVWQGRIATNDLKALYQGRTIVWPEPIRLTLDAHESPEGLVLQSFQCSSEFLRIDAFGSRKGLSVAAQMDLDQLTRRLRDWVDLGDVQLAGKGAVSLSCSRATEDRFEADLVLQGEQLRVVIPQWSVEIKEDIRARAMAAGKIAPSPSGADPQAATSDDRGVDTVSVSTAGLLAKSAIAPFTVSRIDSATVVFQLGRDQGEIRLREPVSNFHFRTRWPVEIRLEGQLADWVPRLKPWLDIQTWQPTGKYVLSVSADASAESVQVHQARMAAAPFSLTGLELQVAEPRMDMTLSGRWDFASGRGELTQAALQADRFLLEAQNLLMESASSAHAPSGQGSAVGDAHSGMKLAGRLRAQGTLEQVQRWLAAGKPTPWNMSGMFVAQTELQTDRSRTLGHGVLSIRNFTYTASPGSTPWKQTELRLSAQGTYDHQTGLLQLTSSNLQGDGIGYVGTAQITPPRQPLAPNAAYVYQAVGQVHYDWQKLTPLLRSYWGTGILLQGSGAQEFRWQGPLDLALAQGSFGVGWQGLEVYGFRGGPAVVRGALSGGRLQIAPLEMDLSEGKLRAGGVVLLGGTPAELVLQKGSAAEQIRVSRPMCASALQYIAPVLADITTVEGRVSLVLDSCRVPLANPAASQIQGRLIIHTIQIGPGPLIRELATLLTREPNARLRQEAVIPFVMAQGRIYHEGLELVFPEITIRTRGYVGLDKSLALTAEMPVPPKWTAQTPRLATALRGQTIQLPIQGTLQKPQLDQQAMRRYTGQLLQKSAENLLQDELQRQLDRLLQPPR